MFKKLIFISILFLGFFAGVVQVKAEDRCWTEEACMAFVEKNFQITDKTEQKKLFYLGADAVSECSYKSYLTGETMGFCKPISGATTEVGFGGKKTFTDIGDFIQYVYKYGVMAAGILAVVMIIAAGFNWVISGGASDKITASKKKIGDALMGLFLAVLSYAILNIINPYMVNMRLPNVWLINTASFGIDFCSELPSVHSEKFAFVGNQDKKITEEDAKNLANTEKYNISYPAKGKAFDSTEIGIWACGRQFLYLSGNSKICRGDYCSQASGSTNMCVPLFDESGDSYKCMPGLIQGLITDNGVDLIGTLTGEGWTEGSNVMNEIDFYIVCNNGEHYSITSAGKRFKSKNDAEGRYVIAARNEDVQDGVKECKGEENVAGFVLYPDFDENWDPFDEPHFVGIKPTKSDEAKGHGQDLGDRYTSDAFFEAVGSDTNFPGKDKPARSYLIPKASILVTGSAKRGYQLNIELKDIKDID